MSHLVYDRRGFYLESILIFFFFCEQVHKGFSDYIVLVILINRFDAFIAIKYFKGIHIQYKYRIRHIAENSMIFFFGFSQFMFEQLSGGNVKAHLHCGADVSVRVPEGRSYNHPIQICSVSVISFFFAVAGLAAFKCLFNRAVHTFCPKPLISIIALVSRLRVESFSKLLIIVYQVVIPVLHGDITGNTFKKILVLILLPVQFRLFFSDFFAHLVYGSSQLSYFMFFFNINLCVIVTFCNVMSSLDQFVYRVSDKPQHENKNNG